MEPILPWLDFFTAIWLAAWTMRAVLRLCSGKIYSVYFVIPVHFFFFGLPLALDHLAGPPMLTNWPGFAAAIQDPASCVTYDLYMTICPVVMWCFGRPGEERLKNSGTLTQDVWKPYKPILIATVISPVVALCFAPNVLVYAEYASVLTHSHTPAEMEFHTLLGSLILLSIFAAAGLLFYARNAGATFGALTPFLLGGIWLNGKRSIVMIAVLVIGTAVLVRTRRRLGPARTIAVAAILGAGFALYSYVYQSRYRTLETLDYNSSYQNMRLDYGRDLVTKMVLMHELNRPDLSILDYRGQSLLFNIVMFVPREWWPEKPWPYAVYTTSAVFSQRAAWIGWGITTSWIDECVANLGWIGMLVAPLSLGLMCRAGDRSGDPVLKILTIAMTMLLLTVQFPAWYPVGYFWLVALYLANSQRLAKGVRPPVQSSAGIGTSTRFSASPLAGTKG